MSTPNPSFADMTNAERLGFNPADLQIEPMAEFDFEAMRNDPAVYYIQIAIRSGLDPDDLAEDEREFMHLIYGDEWKEELLRSIEAMPEIPPEGNRADAEQAMQDFLAKAKARVQ